MYGRTRRLGAATFAALACAALISTSAAWADTPPGPGCLGTAFTDKAGDAQDPFLGSAVPVPGEDALDLTNGWIRTDNGTVSVYLQVANLSGSIPPDSEAANWYFNYSVDGGPPEFVSAALEAGSSSYTFNKGTYDDTLGYQVSGTTPGQAFPGKDGVLRIDIPDAWPGDELDSSYAETQLYVGAPQGLVGLVSQVDSAPDGADHTGAGTLAPITLCDETA